MLFSRLDCTFIFATTLRGGLLIVKRRKILIPRYLKVLVPRMYKRNLEMQNDE